VALKVVSNVLHARRVVQAAVMSILVDSSGVASIAGASHLAVYNNLGVKSNWALLFEVCEDIESVSDGRCGSLSPARSAILGNVLVLVP